ncbi:MAG: hypothetical protein QGF59_12860, partial [Pirellulaceae bacterium]|nr:hypothetical protein [Pirellulaceae bacterium]
FFVPIVNSYTRFPGLVKDNCGVEDLGFPSIGPSDQRERAKEEVVVVTDSDLAGSPATRDETTPIKPELGGRAAGNSVCE